MAGATGSGPIFGPCSTYADWADVEVCCGGVTVDDDETQQLWLSLATEIVWGLTGGRYVGQCVRSFSPCRPACIVADHCSCGGVAKAKLDLGPVPVWGAFVTIDEVEIEVSIEDFRYLVREDGEQWPRCTAGWVVEYTYGWPVPTAIRMATAALACHYAKQCQGEACGLPDGSVGYTREGITVTIADPEKIVAAGATGVDFVDRILGNPIFKPGGALVDLADVGLGSTTTWP